MPSEPPNGGGITERTTPDRAPASNRGGISPARLASRPASLGVWLGGFAIGLLFLALRWNNYDLPLVRDEGEYAFAARLLRHGLAPYEHAFLQKPPMIVYTYLLADLVAVPWFPRALAALSVAASTILLGWIARLELGPGFAWPAHPQFLALFLEVIGTRISL